MPRLFALAVLLAVAPGCVSQIPPPTVDLVPAEALAALLPDSVGAYTPAEDIPYRGYFTDSTGTSYGVVTVARIYHHGVLQLAVNLTSTDDLGRFLTIVTDGGGRAVPDSSIAQDSLFQAVRDAGWEPYWVQHGWLLAGHNRAVEAKSLVSPEVAHQALALVDLARLAALAVEPVAVDSSFARTAL